MIGSTRDGTAGYAFGTVAYEVATGIEQWGDGYDTCSQVEVVSWVWISW